MKQAPLGASSKEMRGAGGGVSGKREVHSETEPPAADGKGMGKKGKGAAETEGSAPPAETKPEGVAPADAKGEAPSEAPVVDGKGKGKKGKGAPSETAEGETESSSPPEPKAEDEAPSAEGKGKGKKGKTGVGSEIAQAPEPKVEGETLPSGDGKGKKGKGALETAEGGTESSPPPEPKAEGEAPAADGKGKGKKGKGGTESPDAPSGNTQVNSRLLAAGLVESEAPAADGKGKGKKGKGAAETAEAVPDTSALPEPKAEGEPLASGDGKGKGKKGKGSPETLEGGTESSPPPEAEGEAPADTKGKGRKGKTAETTPPPEAPTESEMPPLEPKAEGEAPVADGKGKGKKGKGGVEAFEGGTDSSPLADPKAEGEAPAAEVKGKGKKGKGAAESTDAPPETTPPEPKIEGEAPGASDGKGKSKKGKGAPQTNEDNDIQEQRRCQLDDFREFEGISKDKGKVKMGVKDWYQYARREPECPRKESMIGRAATGIASKSFAEGRWNGKVWVRSGGKSGVHGNAELQGFKEKMFDMVRTIPPSPIPDCSIRAKSESIFLYVIRVPTSCDNQEDFLTLRNAGEVVAPLLLGRRTGEDSSPNITESFFNNQHRPHAEIDNCISIANCIVSIMSGVLFTLPRLLFMLLWHTLPVQGADIAGFQSGSDSSSRRCDTLRQQVFFSSYQNAFLLEALADFPVWGRDDFTSIRHTQWGLQLQLAANASKATLELGRTGADATHFVSDTITFGPSLREFNGLSGAGEIQIRFGRTQRKHRLAETADVPKNVKTVVLSISLRNPISAQEKNVDFISGFFQGAWNHNLQNSTLKIASALDAAGSHLVPMQKAHVIMGKDFDQACSEAIFLSLDGSVPITFLPSFARMASRESTLASNVFATQFALGHFPEVGHFTKKQLSERRLFYGSIMAGGIVALVLVGLFMIARKKVPHKYQKIVAETEEGISAAETEPIRATQTGFQSNVAIVADTSLELAAPVPTAIVTGQSGGGQARLAVRKPWRRHDYYKIVAVILFLTYVLLCSLSPMWNMSASSCYEGSTWELHMPFYGLFIVIKSFELLVLSTDHELQGELDVIWPFVDSFFFLFISSMTGFLDGYGDALSIAIVYKCGSILWVPMIICFLVGVVVLQWVVLGSLALFYDSSFKCFFKVLHMDAVAKCIEFNPKDEHAPAIWKAINWARLVGEDIPQGGMQLYFICTVQKNLVMIFSVMLSVSSSAYAAYNAAKASVRQGLAYLARSEARRKLEHCVQRIGNDNRAISEARDALTVAQELGLEDLEDAIEIISKAESAAREQEESSEEQAATREQEQAAPESIRAWEWLADRMGVAEEGLASHLSQQSAVDFARATADFPFDEIVKELARGCPNLTEIKLNWTAVTDSGVKELANGCPNLNEIRLLHCDKVTDTGIKEIARNCPNLSVIWLSETSVTDAGVQEIATHCPQLHKIYLTKTKVTDQGVQELARRCPNLQTIGLDECPGVTDIGVKELLKKCNELKELVVPGSLDDRRGEWRKQYPNVEIE